MMAALFDTIHDNALSKRAEPATLAEFVEFGLQPGDYTSIFYDMGYTVSQSAGLNAVQRQRILKCAIDTGKASKYDVMRFLRQRMNINGMKAGNEIAFQKWKEDYNFIRSL